MTTAIPIFKGATRPPCVFGVPLKPYIAVSAVVFLLSVWIWMPLCLSLVPITLGMRSITKSDDQKFRQLWLSLRVRMFGGSNRAFWRGTTVLRAGNYRIKR